MCVNRGDVAFELGVFPGAAIDGEHGVEDLSSAVGRSFFGLSERGADEVGIRGVELFAQLLDQVHEVVFVATGKCFVTPWAIGSNPFAAFGP